MPQIDSSAIDFVYQPLTWSWKRFPSRFALTEEAYANTAAVFTNHDGYSEGLAVSLSDIPYRYALAAQWNNAGKKTINSGRLSQQMVPRQIVFSVWRFVMQ